MQERGIYPAFSGGMNVAPQRNCAASVIKSGVNQDALKNVCTVKGAKTGRKNHAPFFKIVCANV
jgi:hypothetical protein